MILHLHIDHLVLDGLPVEAGQGNLVKAVIEAELTRLLANGSLGHDLSLGGTRSSVPSRDIHLTGHDTATMLGRRIGQVLYGGISR